jgi:hypothetical protein
MAAQARVSEDMNRILTNFKPGVRITVFVRTPGEPTHDFCMTNDDLREVIAMAERRIAEGPTG